MRHNPGSCCASSLTFKLLSGSHMCACLRKKRLGRGPTPEGFKKHWVHIKPVLTMKDPTKNVEKRIITSLTTSLKNKLGCCRGWLGQERARLRRRAGAQVLGKALWWAMPLRSALRRQGQEGSWDFLVRQPSWIGTPGSVRDCVSKNKVEEWLKSTWDTDPPYTCLCAHTRTDKRAHHWEQFASPQLPWNMYLNGKSCNLYTITSKKGKPWCLYFWVRF